jgi:alkane 1-monooxygenase
MPEHSWNSNHIVTNLVLYQLQRHSDHHAHPTRSFQALRHFEESPQLPSGYASMLIPAYIPALWFRQMDPLVAKHYKGDLSKANILPAKREQILNSALNRARLENPAQMSPIPEGAPAHLQTDGHARFQCSDCGYIYDESQGCAKEGFPAGTLWTKIPDNWPCPDCAVREKVDFVAL